MNTSNAWERFNWVRSGESGSNREGHSETTFMEMTSEERNKVSIELINDLKHNIPFSLQGLTLLKGEDIFETLQASNIDTSSTQKVIILGELFRTTKKPNYANEILKYISQQDKRLTSKILSYLESSPKSIEQINKQDLKTITTSTPFDDIKQRIATLIYQSISSESWPYNPEALKLFNSIKNSPNSNSTLELYETLEELAVSHK